MQTAAPLELATRPIMWNMENIWNTILMYGLFGLSMLVFSLGFLGHLQLWLSGVASKQPYKPLWQRCKDLYKWSLLQKGVRKRTYSGLIIHGLLYSGFLMLLFATTMVLIEHDLGIPVYHGRFYLAVTLLSDVLGFGVIVACGLALHRRKFSKPQLLHSTGSDTGILWFIILLCVQGFALEALRILGNGDPWAAYSPVGNILAQVLSFLPDSTVRPIHFGTWWFHTVSVFVGIALLPYTKLWHIIGSSANLFFSDISRPKAALSYPGDLEALMEKDEDLTIGLQNIKDYSWKHLMDLDACTSCGRCQEVCPAYLSGKPLSPKWLILDSRNHALKLQSEGALKNERQLGFNLPTPVQKLDSQLNSFFFRSINLGDEGKYLNPEFRAENKLVQESARAIGVSVEHRMAGEVMDENVFWSCTTCMACVQACPVGINHVEQIVGNRQNLTMMQGEVPKEAQSMLRLLENQGQTFAGSDDRTSWLEDLNVRILQAGDKVDYLYWIGCISSFDPRKQKIARSLINIMQKAGLDFGILGDSEKCTGDPARRVGNEMLFQMMAKQNVASLREVKFNTMVANCPHCFNTLKNEYPEFGSMSKDGREPRVIHHTKLIRELLDSGQISIKEKSEQSFTFHDACYLGRGNGEYQAPRSILSSAVSAEITEMKMNKEQGLCCGAGGGHFWMDLKQGQRINSIRVDQAAETGAKVIATACPFCMQMMEDGVKNTNRDEQLKVQDVAEVVSEQI
jgi:Fe-S oxidoreductase/nitrate reductase gamma subunit